MGQFSSPDGHHPRGTTLCEAPRGNLPLKRLCWGLFEGQQCTHYEQLRDTNNSDVAVNAREGAQRIHEVLRRW